MAAHPRTSTGKPDSMPEMDETIRLTTLKVYFSAYRSMLFDDWVPPEAFSLFSKIGDLLWEERPNFIEGLAQIICQAAQYKLRLDREAESGCWVDHVPQLLLLAQQAQTLNQSLQELETGALRIWAFAEKRMGIPEAGNGLSPEFHPERLPGPSDYRIVDGRFTCLKPPTLPFETPPEIHHAVQELAERLTRVETWIMEARNSVGRRTIATMVSGPPEIELFQDLKVYLAKEGLDHRKSLMFGRLIHQMLTREKMKPHWGKEIHRRVDVWFMQVEPWLGKEDQAPEEIRMLFEQGPQAANTRMRARKARPGQSVG